MSRIKKLEEKFKELENKCNSTRSAYKWLIDNPSGVSYNITADFVSSYNLRIEYSLNVTYFDNRYDQLISFTPIHSRREIKVKTITFDRQHGNLEIVIAKGQDKNITYYKYQKDMYQVLT